MDRTSAETDALIALLDIGDHIPGARHLRTRSYELLGIVPGTAVVDVGCGSGRATAEMAERGATAVGVDPDERMIAVASER
ncbi:class I SAM-dependent methyltransferase, partial [Cryptosporangium sp. NPDC048952]|uniref:class I SAM-dependent methyltransferase n=1 Tax=Cryptosporangium sp. NPDC048952 TaxID=3363961 RepID=UPI00370FFC4C